MQIQLQTLKAAHIAAAVKDIRYYLTGVLVEFRAQTDVGDVKTIVAATDGHMLFAAHTIIERDDVSEGLPDVGTQIIIPGDVVKACKLRHKSNPFVTLKQISETQWQLGDVLFTPIDGKFPDYRRVIPSYDMVAATPQAPAYYQPDLLTRALSALRTHRDAPKLTPDLYQRGSDAAVMHDGASDCVVVIMPCRPGEAKYQGFAA
jgi:hypothetical protein